MNSIPTNLFAEKIKKVIWKILLHLIRRFCLHSSVSASKKLLLREEKFCRCEKVIVERKVLGHKVEQSQEPKLEEKKQSFAMRTRKFSYTVTKVPGTIDHELHKSEKNRESNKAVLHFPSVLPISR